MENNQLTATKAPANEPQAKATAKYVRTSPRKAGVICSMVRGKSVEEALIILKYIPNKSAGIIADVIKSAAANAENNHNMDAKKLYVSEVFANQGPTLKRFMPRAQGRATQIRKRTSHIGAVVKEK